MSNKETFWHWAEGMKYALEGTKLLFLLNGGAAISILTFAGNTKSGSKALIASMIVFALGAFCCVLTMICAYLAQLHYGNAASNSDTKLSGAFRFHSAGYLSVIGSGLCFFAGIVAAACGMMDSANVPQP